MATAWRFHFSLLTFSLVIYFIFFFAIQFISPSPIKSDLMISSVGLSVGPGGLRPLCGLLWAISSEHISGIRTDKSVSLQSLNVGKCLKQHVSVMTPILMDFSLFAGQGS